MASNSNSSDIQRQINDEIEAVRKAWKLILPELDYRDPKWLKSAATLAAKAGRLPKRGSYDSVISQLQRAGYEQAIDHMAVVRVDGQRHVVFEPYESSCSMNTARRMAKELAAKLNCEAWASLRSWHFPGSTIRITLAPLHTVATVATEAANANGTSIPRESATVGQPWPLLLRH
jgi:hypothetical protein